MKRKHAFIVCTLFSLLGIDNIALGANWNDPSVNLVQSISDHRFRDANTGQYVNTAGMPDNIRNPNTTLTPSTSAVPSTPSASEAPSTPSGNNTQQQSNVNSNNSNNSNNGSNNRTPDNAAATTKKGFSVSAGQVAGAIGGGAMVASTLLGNEEHGVGGIVTGVLGGTTAGASLGGPWGALAGAVAGGLISGSQMFSETDCMRDPETNVFTCCNTAFNKGQRQVEIGGYMFCTEEVNGQMVAKRPYVRQCLQAGSDKPASWWDGLWKDDGWSPECVARFCNGEPPAGVYNLEYTPDLQNFCYTWSIPAGSEGTAGTDPYVIVKQKIESQIQQLQSQCGNLL